MGFIKSLLTEEPPFVLKGNFNDSHLLAIVSRILASRFNIIDISTENLYLYGNFQMNSLFEDSKPDCCLINDSEVKLKFDQLKIFAEKKTIFLVAFNKTLDLGIPEIYVPRLTKNKQSVAIVGEWVEFLGYSASLAEEWKEIYRASYDVLIDIEKTLLAYNILSVENFNKIIESSGTGIQISELLRAILNGNINDAFRGLEKAWNCGIDIEMTLDWFNTRLDKFFFNYKKGDTLDEALDKAKLTGLIRKLVVELHSSMSHVVVDKIWKALNNSNKLEGKAKDIIILLKIFDRY